MPPRFPAQIHEEEERAAKAARRAESAPVRLSELDVPFEQVLAFAFKLFAAQVIIGTPIALVIWLAFLR